MLNIALQTNGSATPKRSNTITQYTNPKITSTQSSVDNFTMSLTKEETGNERGKFERRTDTNSGVLQMVRCSSDEKARGSQGNQATAISLFKDQDHELHPKTMNLFGKKGI